ncbi:MAG: ribonuclease HII, partial [Candidatus Marinamargulisbacteria bacterium]
ASIIAKVYRDQLMKDYDKTYPSFGFKKNKGYGTALHYQALFETGPSPIHRKTFNLTRQGRLF